MAKQRYINTRFWDDGYIVTLDPLEKLLFLYFLTNPLTEICGAYEIPLRRIAFDTGIDADMVTKMVRRFADADKIIYHEGWVLICNFIKHQSATPTVQTGIENAVKRCPDWIKDRLSIAYDKLSHLNLNLNKLNRDRDCIESDTHTEPSHDLDNFTYPVKDLIEAFPHEQFQPAHLGFIETSVLDTPIDREAWKATLRLYVQNHDPKLRQYMPTKTGTLIEVFEKKKKELTKNGTNKGYGKRTDQDVLAESADFYANYPS